MSHLFGALGGVDLIAQGAAGALVAGLWESALLVVAVWLVLRAVPRTPAAARFAIWTAVFCVSAAMPVVGILFGAQAGVAAGQARVGMHLDARWSYAIAAVWAVALLARLVGLAVQGWKLRGLWKRAVPVPDEALAAAGCEELMAGRRVRVCTSEDVDRPSVIGFFAPRILVPTWLFTQLSEMELRHIVLHEMEHLRRRDDWINLVQKIGLVVFPLNPALLWIDRRLATERELACDDGVLRRTQMPRAYAASLASIAEMRLERRMHRRMVALALGVLGAVGFMRGRSEFSRRIESILGRRVAMRPVMGAFVAAALVVMVMGAGVGLARAPQLVSFAPVSGAGSLSASSSQVFRDEVIDGRGVPAGAGVQEASFHVPGPTGPSTLAARPKDVPQRLKPRRVDAAYGTAEAVPLSKTEVSMASEAAVSVGKFKESARRMLREQWLVMTSFHDDSDSEDAPARVVLRLEDGRFYVVPYAAVPVRDGWLIVQL